VDPVPDPLLLRKSTNECVFNGLPMKNTTPIRKRWGTRNATLSLEQQHARTMNNFSMLVNFTDIHFLAIGQRDREHQKENF
jgi:hypothetical protein